MRIKWSTIYVDDQDKALQFYTHTLGFRKKADFSQGNYRWLTVASSTREAHVGLGLPMAHRASYSLKMSRKREHA